MISASRLPRLLRIAAYAACLAVIAALSLAPSEDLPAPNLSDKSEHAITYAVLTALSFALFPKHPRLAVASAIAFGVAMEFAQGAMNLGRQADWQDAAANGLGVLFVALSYGVWRRVARRT